MKTELALPGVSIAEAAAAIRQRRMSAVELTSGVLARIEATDACLRAWVMVAAEAALAEAAQLDWEYRQGRVRGSLHGIPVAVKDIVDVAGFPTRCGSTILADVEPANQDAPIVARLRDAGAIVIGKTVTQEFAAGVVSAPARNPWNLERIPGGSSGGSAVSVASGTSLLAVGTDTGGSIRIPAAAVGVAGFKPVSGTFPLDGVRPLAPSLDTVGLIARSVADLRLSIEALRALAGAPSESRPTGGMRLGVPAAYFRDRLDRAIEGPFGRALECLGGLGVDLVYADWPDAAKARAAAFLINRVETAQSLMPLVAGRPDRLGRLNPDLQLRVVGGRLLPGGVSAAALAARLEVGRSMVAYLIEHRLDGVIVPTLPATAPEAADPVIRYADIVESVGSGLTRLTMPFNATDQPVLAVPCGFADDGLPVGFQLVGQAGDEQRMFDLAEAYERAAGWERIVPPVPFDHGNAVDGPA